MIQKKCPHCNGKAIIHGTSHDAHHIHMGHRVYELIKHSSWMRAHPTIATIGIFGLGVASIVKVFEKHHYKCGCGHTFEA